MSASPEPEPVRPSFDLSSRLQFLHPEKTLALWELPHAPETDAALLARIFGVEAQTYADGRATFSEAARNAAMELLAEPHVRAAVDGLPFARGDTVVALGDSITDDYQSWAEILRELLASRRSGDDIRLLNYGVSGDTTGDVVRRLWHVAAARPAWLIALIATNDARRDHISGEMLVSHEETARNLALIRRWCFGIGVQQVVWMTPPPVLEKRIAAFDRTAEHGLTWRNADLIEKARLVRRQPDLTIDLNAAFDPAALDDLILLDGLHPSLAGQKVIWTSLLSGLSRMESARSHDL